MKENRIWEERTIVTRDGVSCLRAAGMNKEEKLDFHATKSIIVQITDQAVLLHRPEDCHDDCIEPDVVIVWEERRLRSGARGQDGAGNVGGELGRGGGSKRSGVVLEYRRDNHLFWNSFAF